MEKVESENRIATRSEQQILSQYVGWGGLADAFDESKSAWAGEYQQLKELLSSQEYASARESTLNAHYTSPACRKADFMVWSWMVLRAGLQDSSIRKRILKYPVLKKQNYPNDFFDVAVGNVPFGQYKVADKTI